MALSLSTALQEVALPRELPQRLIPRTRTSIEGIGPNAFNLILQFLGPGSNGLYLLNPDVQALFCSSKKMRSFRNAVLKGKDQDISFLFTQLRPNFRPVTQTDLLTLQCLLPTAKSLHLDVLEREMSHEMSFAQSFARLSLGPLPCVSKSVRTISLLAQKVQVLAFTDFSLSVREINLLTIWLPELHTFKISNSVTLSNAHVQAIAKFRLQSLTVQQCPQFGDACLSTIGKIKTLTAIRVEDCHQVTNKGAGYLSEATLLHTVSLSGCSEISNKVIPQFSTLTDLRTLELARCERISSAAVATLSQLRALTSLDISDTSINTGGLAELYLCPSLVSLSMRNLLSVTNLTTLFLQSVVTLERVDLSGCQRLTSNCLSRLRSLPHLTQLIIKDCPYILPFAKNRLQTEKPNLKITS